MVYTRYSNVLLVCTILVGEVLRSVMLNGYSTAVGRGGRRCEGQALLSCSLALRKQGSTSD